jgi:HEAT repeat protein
MTKQIAVALVAALAWSALAVPSPQASPLQLTFEQTAGDLASQDARVRLRAVRLLKDAAYPEAAVPLAAAVLDREDRIQLEAIAAELNIFLAERVTGRRRRGGVVEVRGHLAAESVFAAGRLVLGALPVPLEVLAALRNAMHDENLHVSLEALYAFGALGSEPAGAVRGEVLTAAAPALAAALGSPNRSIRVAALRVVGRVFAWRKGDQPQLPLGDALISLLNDGDNRARIEAMRALGAMRYERATQALTDQLQYYGRGPLAESALEALARIAHPTTSEVFVAHLKDRTKVMKRLAIEGLARLDDSRHVRAIDEATTGEKDAQVALAARFAAVVLAGGSTAPLTEALGRKSLHEQAMGYLVEVAPGRTAALTAFAQPQAPPVQIDIVNVLGLAGDPAALAFVEGLSTNTDQGVARAAARALLRLRAASRAR